MKFSQLLLRVLFLLLVLSECAADAVGSGGGMEKADVKAEKEKEWAPAQRRADTLARDIVGAELAKAEHEKNDMRVDSLGKSKHAFKEVKLSLIREQKKAKAAWHEALNEARAAQKHPYNDKATSCERGQLSDCSQLVKPLAIDGQPHMLGEKDTQQKTSLLQGIHRAREKRQKAKQTRERRAKKHLVQLRARVHAKEVKLAEEFYQKKMQLKKRTQQKVSTLAAKVLIDEQHKRIVAMADAVTGAPPRGAPLRELSTGVPEVLASGRLRRLRGVAKQEESSAEDAEIALENAAAPSKEQLRAEEIAKQYSEQLRELEHLDTSPSTQPIDSDPVAARDVVRAMTTPPNPTRNLAEAAETSSSSKVQLQSAAHKVLSREESAAVEREREVNEHAIRQGRSLRARMHRNLVARAKHARAERRQKDLQSGQRDFRKEVQNEARRQKREMQVFQHEKSKKQISDDKEATEEQKGLPEYSSQLDLLQISPSDAQVSPTDLARQALKRVESSRAEVHDAIEARLDELQGRLKGVKLDHSSSEQYTDVPKPPAMPDHDHVSDQKKMQQHLKRRLVWKMAKQRQAMQALGERIGREEKSAHADTQFKTDIDHLRNAAEFHEAKEESKLRSKAGSKVLAMEKEILVAKFRASTAGSQRPNRPIN